MTVQETLKINSDNAPWYAICRLIMKALLT